MPPYKSLFGVAPGKGLPIGNLTSQFFANIYLNPLDQFVKHTLRARWYVRYVDDLVLVHEDPGQLREWVAEIPHFLVERLASNSLPARELPDAVVLLSRAVSRPDPDARRPLLGTVRP